MGGTAVVIGPWWPHLSELSTHLGCAGATGAAGAKPPRVLSSLGAAPAGSENSFNEGPVDLLTSSAMLHLCRKFVLY
jgi:hypothetical protein